MTFFPCRTEKQEDKTISQQTSPTNNPLTKAPDKKSCEKAVTHFRYPFLIAAQQAVKLKNRLSG
jgi:hypothetical protein